MSGTSPASPFFLLNARKYLLLPFPGHVWQYPHSSVPFSQKLVPPGTADYLLSALRSPPGVLLSPVSIWQLALFHFYPDVVSVPVHICGNNWFLFYAADNISPVFSENRNGYTHQSMADLFLLPLPSFPDSQVPLTVSAFQKFLFYWQKQHRSVPQSVPASHPSFLSDVSEDNWWILQTPVNWRDSYLSVSSPHKNWEVVVCPVSFYHNNPAGFPAVSGSACDPALLSFPHKLSSSTEWILSGKWTSGWTAGLPGSILRSPFWFPFSPLPGLHIPHGWSGSGQSPVLCRNGGRFWMPCGTPWISHLLSLSMPAAILLKAPDHSIR